MRRTVIHATLGLTLWGVSASITQADPFVFVSLPDTQVYSENRFPDGRFPAVTEPRGTAEIFFDQTKWIVANAADIDYVGHLGDIVQSGENLDEWSRAKAAMDLLLQADIPHGTVMGNHDDIPPQFTGGHGLEYQRNYLDNFGPTVFKGRAWYAGSSPNGAANWQKLEHEGIKIAFLNFSIDHPEREIEWADRVIERNPDTIFVIGTHRYLYDFKLAAGRYGESVVSPVLGEIKIEEEPVPGAIEPNSGDELFERLLIRHRNILMIHAGHFHSEWLRLDGRNKFNEPIIQILTDYQSTRNGGDGWLRKYSLDFDANTFTFETYSPTLDRKRTTIDHFVETINQAYLERNQVKAVLGIETDAEYFAFLDATLKDTPAPDGFLYLHPDYDDPEEQAYYLQYLSDVFNGSIPAGFNDIAEWEGLWLGAFAANPTNPLDFRDGPRSPSFTLLVDYSKYYEDERKAKNE